MGHKVNIIFHFVHDKISNMLISEPYSSTPGGDKHMRSGTFLVQNSIPNNFYLKIFLILCVFLAVLSPKLNVLFRFKAKYPTWSFYTPLLVNRVLHPCSLSHLAFRFSSLCSVYINCVVLGFDALWTYLSTLNVNQNTT